MQQLKVKIEYLGHIKDLTDIKNEEIELEDDATVKDLLDMISEKHGAGFKRAVYEPGCTDLKANYMATVNDQLLNQLDGISTKLKDQDRVRIMPVVSGG